MATRDMNQSEIQARQAAAAKAAARAAAKRKRKKKKKREEEQRANNTAIAVIICIIVIAIVCVVVAVAFNQNAKLENEYLELETQAEAHINAGNLEEAEVLINQLPEDRPARIMLYNRIYGLRMDEVNKMLYDAASNCEAQCQEISIVWDRVLSQQTTIMPDVNADGTAATTSSSTTSTPNAPVRATATPTPDPNAAQTTSDNGVVLQTTPGASGTTGVPAEGTVQSATGQQVLVADFHKEIDDLLTQYERDGTMQARKDEKAAIDEIMRKLRHPTIDYQDAYNTLLAMYGGYVQLYHQATVPTGSFNTFNLHVKQLIGYFMENYNKLSVTRPGSEIYNRNRPINYYEASVFDTAPTLAPVAG